MYQLLKYTTSLSSITESILSKSIFCFSFGYIRRAHRCINLSKDNVGQKVSLCGWLHSTRLSSKFLILRDSYGKVQVYIPEKTLRKKLPPDESVIKVVGTVCARPEKDINKNLLTGDIEIQAENITVINAVSELLPFKGKELTDTNESTRLQYRYLDFRDPELQNRLKFRSNVLLQIRQHLCNIHDFVDIETPYLFRKTPGGAKEFIVPTRSGMFYSLPQSPQQFKQLLMVGGLDRYMQIARCFRDETIRIDRQPEFTQLDLEASFVLKEDIYNIVESTLQTIWPLVIKYNFQRKINDLILPFPRMNYSEAIKYYGSDKPDIRFDLKLQEVEIQSLNGKINITGFIVPADLSCKLIEDDIKRFKLHIEDMKLKDILVTNVGTSAAALELEQAFGAKPGDLLIYQFGTTLNVKKILGRARCELANLLTQKGASIMKSGFYFLWVENFPLFEQNGDSLVSTHHPFTAPISEHVDLLYSEPEKVTGQHYDLVCNGQEVGGGSVRIHLADMQQYVLSKVLKTDVEELQHLLKALRSGAPPHAGIALGIDRLMALLTNAASLRDVVAFPKTAEGRCLMSGAPCPLDDVDLMQYGLVKRGREGSPMQKMAH